MVNSPRRSKYRKQRKGLNQLMRRKEYGVVQCSYGAYGLRILESVRLTAAQLESMRRVMTRVMKREGKLWTRVFPDTPVTAKPAEVRMGKGKGSVDFWAVKVKAGRMLWELDGLSEEQAKLVFEKGLGKLPVRAQFVKNRSVYKYIPSQN